MVYLKKIAAVFVFAIVYITLFNYLISSDFAKDHQGLTILLGLAFIPFLRMVYKNVS